MEENNEKVDSNLKIKQERAGSFVCENSPLGTYSCRVCDFKTHFKVLLKKHLKIHYEEISDNDAYKTWIRSYSCKRIACTFTSHCVAIFAKHDAICTSFHSKREMYNCEKCNFSAKHRNALTQHVTYKHLSNEEIEWFECSLCRHSARTLTNFKNHQISRHTPHNDVHWYECDQCNHKTTQRRSLEIHVINKHTSVKDIHWFECDKCSYKSKWKSGLLRHIRGKHSEEKKYNCEKCEYSTKNPDGLRSHVIFNHLSGEEIKWFECDICPYKGKASTNLKRHKMIHHTPHDVIKWRKCEQCDYKTKDSSNLKRHLKQHVRRIKPIKIYCEVSNDAENTLKERKQSRNYEPLNISPMPDASQHATISRLETQETSSKNINFFSIFSGIHSFSSNESMKDENNEKVDSNLKIEQEKRLFSCEEIPDAYACKFCEFKTHFKVLLKKHFNLRHEKIWVNDEAWIQRYSCKRCRVE